MNSLQDISSEHIRQNWIKYKDELRNTIHYELLWDTMLKKYNISNNDEYLIILKKIHKR